MTAKKKSSTFLRKTKYKMKSAFAVIITILLKKSLRYSKYSVIVSPGRTGTRSLGLLFNQVNSCVSRHEPRPTLLDLMVKKQGGKINIDVFFNSFLYRRALYFLKAKRDNSTFIESNYGLTFLLDFLFAKMQNLNAVFLTRNPIDYVVSAFSKEHGREYKDHKLFDSRDHRDRIDVDHFKKWSRDSFDSLNRFDKICWNYRIYHEEYFNLISKGYHLPLFKIEELSNNRERIIELASALKIKLDADGIKILKQGINITRNASDSYIIGKYDSWSTEEQKAFQKIIGPIVQKLGYE